MANTIIKRYYKISIAFCCMLLVSCSSLSPTGSTDTPYTAVAMNLSIPGGEPPDRVTVNINNGDFNQMMDSNFENPDGVTFSDIPLGLTFVMVDAFRDNNRIMIGSGQVDIQPGPNSIHIELNRVFTVGSITGMEESQYDKGSPNIAPFWAGQIGEGGAFLTNVKINSSADVYSVKGDTYLFFLAQITDYHLMPGIGVPQGSEWNNDVFVLYICHESPEFGNFMDAPRFRIQCKIGEPNPVDGELEIISQHVSPVIDKKDKIFNWTEIDIKLIDRPSENKRILELRIPRTYISMTTIGNPGNRGGIVIRYNDENNQSQKFKLDWKNLTLDPLVNVDAWGIMEFN